MTYKLGTLEEYNIADSAAKVAAGWTQDEITNGKVIVTEDGEYTINNLISKKQNTDGSDQYLWEDSSGNIEDPFNILAVWNKAIINPIPPKYYIANNSGEYIYGKVESSSCLNFGSDVTDIEIFDLEADYLARIAELGIVIEEM